MPKDYLEALERLAMPDELHIKECEKLGISLTEDYDILKQYFESINNANPSEALEELEQDIKDRVILAEDKQLKLCAVIKQALINLQKNENKALAFDYLVKHFNFKCEVDALPNGEVWARFVSIQSKDDEGTWDTTAMANLVDHKEEYEFLEKILKNIGE